MPSVAPSGILKAAEVAARAATMERGCIARDLVWCLKYKILMEWTEESRLKGVSELLVGSLSEKQVPFVSFYVQIEEPS